MLCIFMVIKFHLILHKQISTLLSYGIVHLFLPYSDIIKALKHQLDARWKHFGMFLGVEDSLTEAIGTGGKPEDCMQQLVSKWVSKETGTGNHPRTWQTVVEAVKDTGAGALAEDLAHEHGVHLSS